MRQTHKKDLLVIVPAICCCMNYLSSQTYIVQKLNGQHPYVPWSGSEGHCRRYASGVANDWERTM